ncbi:MAG: hypothetical protein ACXADS_08460 [Candidatus Thorarchaeota archaeon]
MTQVALNPFACPRCAKGTLVKVRVEESTIIEAKRHPVIITAKCPNGHWLVVFVDKNFQVRDVEVAVSSTDTGEDEVDNTETWFDTL